MRTSIPVSWSFRRGCEVFVAFSSALMGVGLAVGPGPLAWRIVPVALGEELVIAIGWVLSIAAAFHGFALWLNGSKPHLSRWIRAAACALYLFVTLWITGLLVTGGFYFFAAPMVALVIMVSIALHRTAIR